MAEVLAADRGLPAASAGTMAQRGDGAAPYAVRALRMARGLDLSRHAPRSVSDCDLSTFSRIVAVAPSVAQRLRADHADLDDRLVIWSISDPYGGSMADYRLCLEQIDAALDRLLSE